MELCQNQILITPLINKSSQISKLSITNIPKMKPDITKSQILEVQQGLTKIRVLEENYSSKLTQQTSVEQNKHSDLNKGNKAEEKPDKLTDSKLQQMKSDQSQINSYQTQLTSLKSQHTTISEAISKKQKQNEQLEIQTDWLKQQLDRLKQDHQEQLERRFGQFKQLSLAQSKIKELSQVIISKDNQIILVKHNLASKQQQIQKLKATICNLENTIKNQQEQYKKLQQSNQINESNKQLKRLKYEQQLSKTMIEFISDMTKKQETMTLEFQKTIDNMGKEFEEKKKELTQRQNKVQQQAAAKINKIIQQFNEINTKLSKQSREINEKYRQSEQLKNSYHFFLKKIYVAFLIYDAGLDGNYQKQQWDDQKKILTTEDAKNVLQKSLQVISRVQKMRYVQIKILENVNDTYEAKSNQLIQSVDKLTNSQSFKRTLTEVDKYLRKPTEIKHPIDRIQQAIYKFVKKADQFIDQNIVAMNKAAENQNFDMAKVICEKQHEVMLKNEQLQKKQSQLKVLREKIQKQLQGQMQKLRQTASENLTKYRQQCQNSNRLQDEIQTLKKKDIQQLKRQLQQMRNKNNELLKQLNPLKREKQKFQKNYQLTLSLNQHLQLNVQQLQDKNLTLTEQIQHLKSTTQQLSTATNQQLSLLQSRNQSLSQELSNVKSLLEHHQKQVAEKTTQIQSLKSQLNQQRWTANNKGVILQAVQNQLNKCKQENDGQKARIMTLERQLNIRIDDEIKKCENLMNAMKKQEQQIVSLRQTLGQISNTLAAKMRVKRQLTPDTIIQAIKSYSPSVGKFLITSTIMLGLDWIRPQINAACQKFAKKTLSKSTVLFRYPDSKNMVSVLASKEFVSSPFIILYKTMAGWVVGSYSEGMRKPTFFFSFGSEEYQNRFEKEEEAKKLKIHMPETPSEISAIEFVNAKFLQYGNGEFKISAIDLSSGTANSDVVSNSYYGFDWKKIFRDKNQSKIMLSEVQLHSVEFG